VSPRARLWGLRLLSLAIAIVLWFIIAVEKRETQRQKGVEASVSYNPPSGLVILNPIQTVTVVLNGPDRLITSLNPFQVDVQVDLKQAQPGTVTANLTAEHVVRPQGLTVVSIKPSQLTLRLDRERTLRLPVEPQFVGEPAAGAVLGDAEVSPAQVQVVGPESMVDRVDHLETSPIRLDGHALDFEEVVNVVSPEPLVQVLQPSRVRVHVPLHLQPVNRPDHGGGKEP
jgi:YbbR domain-containing protein